jgi:hypothetical protein
MSIERLEYLASGTLVTFELEGKLPILREEYRSAQAGTVVLKGFFNPRAHIELLNGARYRTLRVRKDPRYPTEIVYPVVHLPDRTEILSLRTPLKYEGTAPRMRYTTRVGDDGYVFQQINPARRGFELWDGVQMQKLVERGPPTKLMPDLTILAPVPTLLVLLFPWLDNQTMA